jgi:hypothetical protein
MSLAATLSLKKDDNTTTEDYVKVDLPQGQTGTLRRNSAIDFPDSASLLIRSQAVGKGLSKADRHTLTIDKVVSDVAGNLIRGSVSLSIVFPQSTTFTAQMIIDLIHQVLDVVVSTSSFDVDDTVVKSLLRGES